MILQLKNGIELKLDVKQAKKLAAALRAKTTGFIQFEGQFIPISLIGGIFSEGLLGDAKQLKAGNWQCKYGNWHDRFKDFCSCGQTVVSMGDKARGHIYRLEDDTDRLDDGNKPRIGFVQEGGNA